VLTVLCTGTEALATPSTQSEDGRWHFYAVPYLWLPSVSASAKLSINGLRAADGSELGPVSLDAEVSPGDYLSNLSMAFMFMGEARKGPWSIYTDVIYTSFADQDSEARDITGPLGLLTTEISGDAKADLSATVWTLGAGHRLVERPSFRLDLMAGFRYFTMNSDLTLKLRGTDGLFSREQKVSMDQKEWDGIVGVRGQVLFTETHWFIPYYLDVGTGGSNWTWQALLGLGYRLDWGEVTLAVRSLSYDFDKDDADITLTGPGLGVGLHW